MIDYVYDFCYDSGFFIFWCKWIIVSYIVDKNLIKKIDEYYSKKYDLEKERKYFVSDNLFLLFEVYLIYFLFMVIFFCFSEWFIY